MVIIEGNEHGEGVSCGVKAKVLDYSYEVSNFKLQ